MTFSDRGDIITVIVASLITLAFIAGVLYTVFVLMR